MTFVLNSLSHACSEYSWNRTAAGPANRETGSVCGWKGEGTASLVQFMPKIRLAVCVYLSSFTNELVNSESEKVMVKGCAPDKVAVCEELPMKISCLSH